MPASNDTISVTKGGAILTSRLLPKRLFRSTYPIFSERGENLVDTGEAFVIAKSDLFMACTPMILNKNNEKNRAGSLQVCVADLDNDGKFDHYFTETVGQLQRILIQGNHYNLKVPAVLQSLRNDNKFIEIPINTDIGLPIYSIKYGGHKDFYACLGSGIGGKEFGCIERNFYWIEKDKEFSVSGAEFTIDTLGRDKISLKFEKGLPMQTIVILPPRCLLCIMP